MTKKLAVVLFPCALLAAAPAARAQNGPDNDLDAAPGYTTSVLDHEPADSRCDLRPDALRLLNRALRPSKALYTSINLRRRGEDK